MPSTPEQLIDQATRHAVHLESLKAQSFNEMRTVLQDVQDGLVSRLSRVKVGSAWTRERLETQIRAYSKMLRGDYTERVLKSLNRQIGGLASYEMGFEQRSLQNVYQQHQFYLPTDKQLMAAVNSAPLNLGGRFQGSLLRELHNDFSNAQIQTLTRSIRSAFAGGQTTQQLIGYLKREAFPINQRQLEAVVRTSLQHSASQARKATYEANSDIIKGYRIIATLDGRTSEECRFRDGMVEPLENPNLPPYHFNCRTSYTATLDDRFAFLEEGGTRSARDPETGKIERVDAKQSYYGWLKNQPASFQDDVLGPARGKLLRDGGLSAERFRELQLDRNFRPRTLDEMRAIEPLAFQREATIFSGREIPTEGATLQDFERVFTEGNKAQLDAIKAYPAPGSMKVQGEKGHYSVAEKKELVANPKTRNGQVVFHEYGHHLDYEMGKKHFGGEWDTISNVDKGFQQAIYNDKTNLHLGEFSGSLSKNKVLEDLAHQFGEKGSAVHPNGHTYIKWSPRTHGDAALGDIVDALTAGEFQEGWHGMYGHGRVYYSREGSEGKEIFANLFSMRHTTEWDRAVKLFPEMTARFDILIKDFL